MARAKKEVQTQPETEMTTDITYEVSVPDEVRLSNVAKVHTRVLDTHGVLRSLKKEFMLACSRIRGSEEKLAVMMDFLDLAPQIAQHQFKEQKRRRDNELK